MSVNRGRLKDTQLSKEVPFSVSFLFLLSFSVSLPLPHFLSKSDCNTVPNTCNGRLPGGAPVRNFSAKEHPPQPGHHIKISNIGKPKPTEERGTMCE